MTASSTETAYCVGATPAAVLLLQEMLAKHGPLMLFQSDGFANGGSPILVKEGALPLEPSDMQIAVVAGVPLWVDEEQYLRAEEPQFVLDVAAGPAEGAALGLKNEHLITRAF